MATFFLTPNINKMKDPQTAFNKAIQSGRLSNDKSKGNYAGMYMYMGTNKEGKDLFKHVMTREYIK